mmetsp:Transcript_41636/g.96481  ORF Transcript_41636/g.96481 Transcript_41636/m.96481 type:complete len:207 (-) Transcript_41636:834-1454(-)
MQGAWLPCHLCRDAALARRPPEGSTEMGHCLGAGLVGFERHGLCQQDVGLARGGSHPQRVQQPEADRRQAPGAHLQGRGPVGSALGELWGILCRLLCCPPQDQRAHGWHFLGGLCADLGGGDHRWWQDRRGWLAGANALLDACACERRSWHSGQAFQPARVALDTNRPGRFSDGETGHLHVVQLHFPAHCALPRHWHQLVLCGWAA